MGFLTHPTELTIPCTCPVDAFCDAWPGMAELEEWKIGDGIPTVGKAGERHRQKLVALKKSINASKPYQVRLGLG